MSGGETPAGEPPMGPPKETAEDSQTPAGPEHGGASPSRMMPPEAKPQAAEKDWGYSKLPDEDRSTLEQSGITQGDFEQIMSLGERVANKEEISQEELAQYATTNEKLEKLDPKLKLKIAAILTRAGEEAEEAGDSEQQVDTSQPVDDKTKERLREQRAFEARAQEAHEAVQKVIDNDDPDLDVTLRDEASRKMHEAREHHDHHDQKHGADALQKGSPFWYKALMTAGVLLYLYIGMQYAAASMIPSGGKQ